MLKFNTTKTFIVKLKIKKVYEVDYISEVKVTQQDGGLIFSSYLEYLPSRAWMDFVFSMLQEYELDSHKVNIQRVSSRIISLALVEPFFGGGGAGRGALLF